MAEDYHLMRHIHYMARHPDRPGEFLYPNELSYDYQGYGAFCLTGPGGYGLGSFYYGLDDVYLFYTVREEELSPVKLYRAGLTTYVAPIQGIGQFHFRAKRLHRLALYTGNFPLHPGELVLGYLVPLDPRSHEVAVLERKFYFAGYSPKIGVSPPDMPKAPTDWSPS